LYHRDAPDMFSRCSDLHAVFNTPLLRDPFVRPVEHALLRLFQPSKLCTGEKAELAEARGMKGEAGE
jgi:hypothetical protein